MSLALISMSAEETRSLGHYLGRLAMPGDLYLLVGPLGAGKTCLVQGLASGLGISGYALSPSFVLVRELKGRLPLYHIDLYRLENPIEVIGLGLDEYFNRRGVSAVEWADRAADHLPRENLLIEITYLGESKRQLVLRPSGERYKELMLELMESYQSNSNKDG